MIAVFCDINDFCHSLLARKHPQLSALGGPKKHWSSSLSLSEVMTILVWFHASHYRTLQHFYFAPVLACQRAEFPGLPSYTRFVELISLTLPPMCAYRQTRQGPPTGLQLMDSLPIRVCHNRRIHSIPPNSREITLYGLLAKAASVYGLWPRKLTIRDFCAARQAHRPSQVCFAE